jgi:hypothetical protein
MTWYAKIQNNKVTDVTFVADNLDSNWLYREFGGVWLKCDEKGLIRNLLPSVGFTYDEMKDAFYPPQPFTSWIFDEDAGWWKPPIDAPADDIYIWDESTISWVHR